MARANNGSWARSPNELGQLVFTAASGKTHPVDCIAVAGGKKAWDVLTPSARFLLGYGTKQWIVDPLGSKSGADWMDGFFERKMLAESGQAGSDALPYIVEAIARIKNLPVEKVRAQVFDPKVTAEQRAAWYATKAVQAAVTLIVEERKRVSAEAVLASAGAGSELPDFK